MCAADESSGEQRNSQPGVVGTTRIRAEVRTLDARSELERRRRHQRRLCRQWIVFVFDSSDCCVVVGAGVGELCGGAERHLCRGSPSLGAGHERALLGGGKGNHLECMVRG